MEIESHIENIICPECDSTQEETVEHTFPFYSYVHKCARCNYIIMESEWNRVELPVKSCKKKKGPKVSLNDFLFYLLWVLIVIKIILLKNS